MFISAITTRQLLSPMLFGTDIQMPVEKVFSKDIISDFAAIMLHGRPMLDSVLAFNKATNSLNLVKENPNGSTTVVMFGLDDENKNVLRATISKRLGNDMANANPSLLLYQEIKGIPVFSKDFIASLHTRAYLDSMPKKNTLQYG